MSQGAKMRPRHVILARPLLPQNPTSRPRRKGFDLTARITEGIEAAGRGALRPGSRKPDPRCGRACPECGLFGELDICDDNRLNDPARAKRHLVAGRSPYQPSRADARWLASKPIVRSFRGGREYWSPNFGNGCSCGLLHRPATQMPCCDELCSVWLDPKDIKAFDNRGSVYGARKDYDHAIADYAEAIRLDPKHALAFNNRGYVYLVKMDYDRPIADLAEAIQIEPSAGRFNARCFMRALGTRDLPQALDDCNEALRLLPDDGDTLNSHGLVQFKLGAFDQARADFDASLKRDAGDAGSLYGRGLTKLKTGDTAGGIGDIAAAKAVRADIAEVYAGYGIK